jgi:hypothetical protein
MEDIKSYDLANIYVLVTGAEEIGVGEIWIEYDITFYTPQVDNTPLETVDASAENWNPWVDTQENPFGQVAPELSDGHDLPNAIRDDGAGNYHLLDLDKPGFYWIHYYCKLILKSMGDYLYGADTFPLTVTGPGDPEVHYGWGSANEEPIDNAGDERSISLSALIRVEEPPNDEFPHGTTVDWDGVEFHADGASPENAWTNMTVTPCSEETFNLYETMSKRRVKEKAKEKPKLPFAPVSLAEKMTLKARKNGKLGSFAWIPLLN